VSHLLKKPGGGSLSSTERSSSGNRSRIQHLPGDHAYVRAVTPDSVEAVVVPDPSTRAALTPGWVTANAERFDLLHLHFGFDHLTPEQLEAWLAEVRRLNVPLIFTIHDLRNPHHTEPALHQEHLALLVPAADALITLTEAAADVVARRWGRRPVVLPHPPVTGPGPAPARTSPGRLAGVHLKDLRRNVVEPGRVVRAAARGAQAAGGRLRVDVHPGAAAGAELAGVRRLAQAGAIDLRIHERFDDDRLLGYLGALDVSVLPYRFGTHSGWLEACRDVGTRVVAPSCGFYRDQWAEVVGYPSDERAGLDEAGLAEAVRRALRAPALAPLTPDGRDARLRAVRTGQADIYAALVASSPAHRRVA
jgi:beta-1,4-mannosyltransferase